MANFQVTGALVWYYQICPRETWFLARQLVADQDDENVDYGRFLQEKVYQRDKKDVTIGHLKVDVMKSKGGQLVIGEVKKSSASEDSARLQLLFYLNELQEMGVTAKGELLFPEERKKEQVILDEEGKKKIEELKEKIKKVVFSELPPPPRKVRWCKNCAYREMCWA